jgi:hypothetical protein
MAEYALFIGWGAPRVGREAAAGKVFAESLAYWNGLKAAGEIESVETVLLDPHGGDLGGFALLRGDAEKLARIAMAPDYQRLSMRAAACLDHVGIVNALVDAGAMRVMGEWPGVIADLV